MSTIAPVSKSSRGLVRPSLDGFFESFGQLVAWVYIVWFGTFSLPARRLITGSVTFLTCLAALHFLVETVIALLQEGVLKVDLPEILLLVPAAYLLYHSIRQLFELRRRPELIHRVNGLVRDLAALRFATPGAEKRDLDEFITRVLVGFRAVFKDIPGLYLNVMLPDADDGLLAIRYQIPSESRYDASLRLKPGEGAAGLSYAEAALVYVPHIRFCHGVLISKGRPSDQQGWRSFIQDEMDYTLAKSVYVQAQLEPYKAILCAPVVGGSRVVGVLNLDVDRGNRFSESEIQIAEVAATFLGAALERYHAVLQPAP